MTDRTIAAKIIEHLKSKGIMAIVNIDNNHISAILHKKQFCFFANSKKDLIHKTKLITSGIVTTY